MQARVIDLRFCTHMPALTSEWPGVRRVRFRHLRRLATAGPVSWWWIVCTFSLNLTLDYTLTLDLAVSGTRRPETIWWVWRQQQCLLSLLSFVETLFIIKDYHLGFVEVTPYSCPLSLAPSKQRSRIHVRIEQHLKYVQSDSSPRRK
jgi:hypothetical protein